MLRTTTAIAVGAAAIVLLVVGVGILQQGDLGFGDRPSPDMSVQSTMQPTLDPKATPGPISLTGQIAFVRRVDGNTDIYLMNVDRTGLVRLTSDAAMDAAPSWSADGTRLLFTRGVGDARDVYLVNADGTGETRLTSSPEGEDSAAFSPDGSEVIFLRSVDPDYFDIFAMDADGSNERLVWHRDGVWASGPQWSPDGQSIFFSQDESGGGEIDLVRLDLATDRVSPIADGPGDDSQFAISPDGSTIAFQSDRSPGGIFLADIDGGNVRHLTGSWDRGHSVSWSPDGQHLVYSAPDGWLYVVAADGSETTKWAEGHSVAWRPRA